MKNNFFLLSASFLVFMFLIACNTSVSPNQSGILNPNPETQNPKPETRNQVVSEVEPPKSIVPRKEYERTYNDNARYIAGLKGEDGSEFLKIENNLDWKQYASWSNTTWQNLNEGQLQKVRSWALEELSSINNSKNKKEPEALFYPFSGADFLYADALFSKAEQTIMIGLEPVGKMPDIRKIPTDFWENYFLALRTAMDDILKSSFFKTKDMKTDFRIQELKGTLPIMMIFLARTGHRIITIEPVEITDSAKVVDSHFDKVAVHQYGKMNGVRITYQKDSLPIVTAPQKTVYYFSIDLSDASLKQKPQFEAFLNNYGQVATFIKSASYLMHQSNFVTIRSLILKHSETLVQDDSGIPLKYFASTQSESWQEPLFYGAYKTPIPMFSKFYQEDLKKKFADTSFVKPLDFRIGYQTLANKSNVMVVKKRN